MKQNVWLLAASFIVIVIILIKYVFIYFAPFILGVFIATIIHPIIDFWEKKGCSRTYSSFVFVICTFGSLFVFISIAIIGLWNEIEQLTVVFQKMCEGSYQWTEQIAQVFLNLPEPFSEIVPLIYNKISQLVIDLLLEATELIRIIPNALVFWLLAGLTTFFVSCDKLMIVDFLSEIMPKKWHKLIFSFKRSVMHHLSAFVKAQLILMWITTCLSLSGFILLNQPYAWVLGITSGVFDLVPVLGPSGVFIPVIIYNITTHNFTRAVGISIVWMVVLVLRQLWEPQIIGSHLGLHPLTSVVALYMGIKLFGLSGFFIGPLLIVCCKAFYIVVCDEINN